ncbi:probable aldo-keto reductase 1 isoform X1 [Cryptomeria japonica]|uniref:probable aldo-keto reductase 1 isoform X1 n=1 Tax=Cryptomeria japonica TaxID=3369 RepID=UPI0027DA66D3|nr:probable aldo-keto reductase 1 isoform X1 [Cryptomeria japonica]
MEASLLAVPPRELGAQGFQVSALGLGCSGLSGAYGDYASEEDATALFQHAFNKGVTFFDTADIYGNFTNEILVGKALKCLPRESIQIATKFGWHLDGNGKFGIKGTAEHIRQACEASLQRLGTEYIDLYYQHRVDTQVPIEETVGEMKKLVQEGKIKYIGLCEASVDTIRRAYAVHPITAVQYEWSLWSREIEEEIIPTCRSHYCNLKEHQLFLFLTRELGIGIVPYSPLGRGFFSGKVFKATTYENTRWSFMSRFKPENLKKNEILYERVSNIAKKHNCTPAQLALAWVLHQGDDVVPIPGTTKTKNLDDNIASLSIKLSKRDHDEISNAVPENEIAGLKSTEEDKSSWKFAFTPPCA